MLHYLLDTNIVSEILRPEPNPKVVARFRQYKEEMALSATVWHELWYGTARLEPSRKRTVIQEYLEQVLAPTIPILPYDERAAEWHATERARLAGVGKMPPFADGQIAAVAHVNELILVTFNTADYQHFQEIQLEDWSK